LNPNPRSLLIFGVLLFVAGVLLPLLAPIHPWFAYVRWAGLLAVALANPAKRSLTGWIFLSMLIGGELGFDLERHDVLGGAGLAHDGLFVPPRDSSTRPPGAVASPQSSLSRTMNGLKFSFTRDP